LSAGEQTQSTGLPASIVEHGAPHAVVHAILSTTVVAQAATGAAGLA
jgi:hypothetical protein